MCAMVKTRNGLTVTTASPAAADLYQEGLDLVLSQNYGPEEKIRAAIDADDGSFAFMSNDRFDLRWRCKRDCWDPSCQAAKLRGPTADHAIELV